MRYNQSKSWIVLVSNGDNLDVYNFSTRYQAFTFFSKVKEAIEEKYPDEDKFIDNIESSRGNAYYGLVDKEIYVHLCGEDFVSSCLAEITFKNRGGIL